MPHSRSRPRYVGPPSAPQAAIVSLGPVAVSGAADPARQRADLTDALTALHEAGKTLAHGDTVDRIARLGADLTLAAIPTACRADVQITREGHRIASARATRVGRRRPAHRPAPGILCVPFRVEADPDQDQAVTGALRVFTDAAAEFDQVAAQTAAILAGQVQAAVARAAARELAGQLQTALGSNRTIGTAVGILMTTHDLSSDQAFQLLRMLSQSTNRKLALITRDIVTARAIRGSRPVRRDAAGAGTRARWSRPT